MSTDLNQIVISGRLTQEPVLHYVAKGENKIPVANFSIATDNFGKTSYIPIIVWQNYAESCANYLEKGQEVFVTGRLYSRVDTKSKRSFLEVHATLIKFGNKAGKPNG
ncbi:single-stranded DNA-binding protein [Alkalihalobacillus oceani]|uniref:Single-stranded DNA-binding protein n=1 Tax=Halalkalibacter oceani TaxID=1653776 RepID=A0A9X2DQY0_9BACI|nr:single-stranded DNA-binding protein [Halalkalibacter oceani]MCM3715481.1 single-stranded DNA-binding protein [Halalkalibacter oceani]